MGIVLSHALKTEQLVGNQTLSLCGLDNKKGFDKEIELFINSHPLRRHH